MTSDRTTRGGKPARRSGMVLLEVVLAMAIFAGSAGVLLSCLSASSDALVRMRRDTQAADLLCSLRSMLEAGIIAPSDGLDAGPQPFADGPSDWTWQINTAPIDGALVDDAMVEVTFIVTHTPTGQGGRLVQWMPNRFATMGASELQFDGEEFFE